MQDCLTTRYIPFPVPFPTEPGRKDYMQSFARESFFQARNLPLTTAKQGEFNFMCVVS